MRLPDQIAYALIPRFAAGLIRLLRATMRVRCAGRERVDALRARGRPYIHAFWHGQLLLMPYSYRGGRIAIMISEHRDGEYIARTMGRFGHAAVRGSTTSGGAAALRKAVRMAREGCDIGFTPDGPRGPRHRAQMGVVLAARLSGLPIVPVAFAASRAKTMGSWDGFIVPYPFSRGVFVYGEPLEVAADADEAGMEAARVRLEEALEAGSSQAETLVVDRDRFAALRPLREPA